MLLQINNPAACTNAGPHQEFDRPYDSWPYDASINPGHQINKQAQQRCFTPAAAACISTRMMGLRRWDYGNMLLTQFLHFLPSLNNTDRAEKQGKERREKVTEERDPPEDCDSGPVRSAQDIFIDVQVGL